MKGWQNNHWLGLIKFKVDNAKWSWCIERHETKLQWCGYGWVCSVYVTSSRWDKVHNETESDGHAWNGFLFIGGFHIRHLAKLAIGLLLLPMQGLNMMHNRKARMRCLCGQLFSGSSTIKVYTAMNRESSQINDHQSPIDSSSAKSWVFYWASVSLLFRHCFTFWAGNRPVPIFDHCWLQSWSSAPEWKFASQRIQDAPRISLMNFRAIYIYIYSQIQRSSMASVALHSLSLIQKT